MARQVKGAIVEHVGRDGRVYRSIRVTAYGKRRFWSLGAVSRADAETQLRYTLTDLERGTWRPPEAIKPPPEPEQSPTLHHEAEKWWLQTNVGQLAASTQEDYRWRLDHLLGTTDRLEFAEHPIDQITFDDVELFIARKLQDGLSPRSVNMCVTLMAAILEGAVERGLIARNPAKGKRRRVKERAPRRTYLESAEQIAALLQAAGELDGQAREDRRHVHRKAILSVLVFAGLRIGELCALRWRDVDLATGWLTVQQAKTAAGRRRVKLRGALRDELLSIRAGQDTTPDAFVFATSTGARPSRENIRNRVLAPAAALASEQLVDAGYGPLPEHLTPHSLRRTFASVLYALGEDPGVVMDEMGHTSPALALAVYRQTMRRGDDEKARLRALVEGAEVAFGGIRAAEAPEPAAEEAAV